MNSWHAKLAIYIILQEEKTLEEKLDMLTSIGLQTSSEGVFAVTEEIRHELANIPDPKERKNNLRNEIHCLVKKGSNESYGDSE